MGLGICSVLTLQSSIHVIFFKISLLTFFFFLFGSWDLKTYQPANWHLKNAPPPPWLWFTYHYRICHICHHPSIKTISVISLTSPNYYNYVGNSSYHAVHT
ncbi:unnamed protein product [Absidia cylindrospora]